MTHKVRLRLGRNNASFSPMGEVIDCGNIGYEGVDTSLKDIAIILWCLSGAGVLERLGKEISNKTGLKNKFVVKALSDICQEYINMSDEEAFERTFNDNKK